MKNYKHILLLGTLLMMTSQVFAQRGSVSGTVSDSNGELIVGAQVFLVGTTSGAITNEEGFYSFEALSGNYMIRAAFVGYASSELEIEVMSDQTFTQNFTLTEDLLMLSDVVVTGVANPKSKLESSVSVTSINQEFLSEFGAQTTAETFKVIPGIRSEASGGEGNANIAVRGIPIASGGAKYLQLYEDGLPIMQFGDISFGNADIFLRADATVARIEAIKGGSASTFASNSPAGIINFISKSGAVEGGSISSAFGLNYRSLRTDFEYGSPIGNGMSYHIGGFYRQGEGPRNAGYTANLGGQLKANLTKNFDNGFVRVYAKLLNDKAIGYLPMPVQASGNADDPNFESIPGFDATNQTLHSPEFLYVLGVDGQGNSRTKNIADGMNPNSAAIGAEFDFDLGDGWNVNNKFRYAMNSGSFTSPFPAQVAEADVIGEDIAGAGYELSYANGENAGQAIADPSSLNGNGLLMRIHLFDTEIDNLNNYTNDISITKELENVTLTGGFYKAYQRIAMTWLWQTFLTDVSGDGPNLLNISDAGGNPLSENGLTAHGVPFWGNCCTRGYDMRYDISAPYLNIGFDVNESLNIEASARYDIGTAFGYYLGNKQTAIDVNNNGTIDAVEQSVTVLNNETPNTVDYDFDYFSFSVGANYLLNENQAVFGRISKGGRANADRLLYSPFLTPAGETISGLDADEIVQAELGFKYRSQNLALFATGFYTTISEQNEEFGRAINKDFNSYGVELETVYTIEKLSVRSGATYTKAEITKSLNPAEVGNSPRRVPDLIYNISPSYNFGSGSVGLSLIGTTKVWAQDDNVVALPAYAYLNAFASYGIAEGLSLRANVNNLTNTLGFTEMEGDPFVNGSVNYLRARSITGTAASLTVKYSF
ncbi:MAG: TonB-dependent receptor [Balneola sp.]